MLAISAASEHQRAPPHEPQVQGFSAPKIKSRKFSLPARSLGEGEESTPRASVAGDAIPLWQQRLKATNFRLPNFHAYA